MEKRGRGFLGRSLNTDLTDLLSVTSKEGPGAFFLSCCAASMLTSVSRSIACSHFLLLFFFFFFWFFEGSFLLLSPKLNVKKERKVVCLSEKDSASQILDS